MNSKRPEKVVPTHWEINDPIESALEQKEAQDEIDRRASDAMPPVEVFGMEANGIPTEDLNSYGLGSSVKYKYLRKSSSILSRQSVKHAEVTITRNLELVTKANVIFKQPMDLVMWAAKKKP